MYIYLLENNVKTFIYMYMYTTWGTCLLKFVNHQGLNVLILRFIVTCISCFRLVICFATFIMLFVLDYELRNSPLFLYPQQENNMECN